VNPIHLIGGLALLLCALFTGAAIYINLVEHPARLSCGTEAAARQWAPSYHRATRMQASLAIAAAVTGIATWLHGEGIAWLWGGLLILAVVPFSLVVIKPVNDRLLARGRDLTSNETRQLLEQWGRLHAVRSVLGLAASLVFVYGVMSL
jgi:anthrone oxygenase-like protein